jgi:hypothetical protein
MKIRSPILAPFAAVCALVGVPTLASVPVLAAEACPNEQVRAESNINPTTGMPFSLGLPECRAYEMVTPPLKNGSPVSGTVAPDGVSSIGTVVRVGSEGASVLVDSKGIWPGGEQPANDNLFATQALEGVQYRITRGESGWQFKPREPPVLREFVSALLPSPVDMNSDMSTNGIWQGAGIAPAEAKISIRSEPNFYLLEPDDTLAEIGPSVPLSDQDGAEAGGPGTVAGIGASSDLSHMLFSLSNFRWPFDQTKLNVGSNSPAEEISSLYEYSGTSHSGEGSEVPTLVGVDNTGTLIGQCGTEAGGYEGEGADHRSDQTGEAEARPISVGGSSVFFTVRTPEPKCKGGTGPAADEVFARVGLPGAGTAPGSAVTVNVAGTSECATASFDSCNVTEAVKYQGASADGSKLFFTSEQSELVAGDVDATNNLYECVLPGDSGAALTPVMPVNPCPDLVRVSVPLLGARAEVQSVVAVSQDGSHVYFIAKGVLSGENAERNTPQTGQDNLYVWDAGHTAFIATLSSGAFKLGEAQATPDGDSLVFMSSADLMPGDTGVVSQIFLYEAQRETLKWVSEGQGGSEDGNDTTDPSSLTSGAIDPESAQLGEGRRVISEDGSVVVFESSAALTAQVHGGRDNVYLWRNDDLHLISDGTPEGTHHDGGRASGLIGIDASGQNVFFTTEASLVTQDNDELSDLYDARIDGGYPAPKIDECSGEACQQATSAPPAPATVASLLPSEVGNLVPLPPSISLPKLLTRAQKLAQALKACRQDKAKQKRARCEATAQKRYGADRKTKPNAKHGPKKKRRAGKSASRWDE